MANFASDYWHQMYLGDSADASQSAAGTSLYDKGLTGAIFFNQTDLTVATQLWQLYPFNSTYYVLRSKDSGPTGYLTVRYSAEEDTPGKTIPLMTNASIADVSMFWRIRPWNDGTFYLCNAANGTDWNLVKKPNSLMAMTTNFTWPHEGQGFSFKQLSQIQNKDFSTVILPTGIATRLPSSSSANSLSSTSSSSSTPPASSSSPPPPTSSSNSGLSTGAKAGIGAGIGISALAALLILGFLILKKRKRAAHNSTQEPAPTYDVLSQQAYETEGKPLQREGPEELDAPLARPAELNSDTSHQPAELPTSNGR